LLLSLSSLPSSQTNQAYGGYPQAILDKLANLQDELHTTQENHLAFQRDLESQLSVWESKHDILTNTLTSLFPTLSSQTITLPPHMNPTSPFNQFSMDATSSIPPPVGNNNHMTCTTTTTTIPPNLFSPIRPPKIQLSFFDGTNPFDWLFEADQFFQFYNIPWDSRLNMTAFYMRGDALSWFKWIYQNHQLTD